MNVTPCPFRQPSVWGPPLWRVMECVAMSFPARAASAAERARVGHWVRAVGTHMIPCRLCQRHYRRYVAQHFSDRDTVDRRTLLAFVVRLHNDVNRRLGKPVCDVRAMVRLFCQAADGLYAPYGPAFESARAATFARRR